jgi:ribosomal protein S14
MKDLLLRLPYLRAKGSAVWLCSECGVRNSNVISKVCRNCGRDPAGNPGVAPKDTKRV